MKEKRYENVVDLCTQQIEKGINELLTGKVDTLLATIMLKALVSNHPLLFYLAAAYESSFL